jgi:hypothetical protein
LPFFEYRDGPFDQFGIYRSCCRTRPQRLLSLFTTWTSLSTKCSWYNLPFSFEALLGLPVVPFAASTDFAISRAV